MSNETIGRIGWWPLCAALVCMPLCALFGSLAGFTGSAALAIASKACLTGFVYGIPVGAGWLAIVVIVAWLRGRLIV